MKTSIRPSMSYSVLSLIALPLLAATSAVAYDEGGGHNGPDLNGPSIPVQVDRLLTKGEMGAVLTKCMGEVADEVAQQVLRTTDFTLSNVNPMHLADPISNTLDANRVEGTCWGAYEINGNHESITKGDYISVNNTGIIESGKSKTSFAMSFIQVKNSVTLESPNFPFVRFDASYADVTYDDLGRVETNKLKVSNIRIYQPKELRVDEPLINYTTKRPTAVTMNLRRYVDCIKSSVQN